MSERSAVPELIDARFRENKVQTLVYSHWKRAFWACFRENWVYNFGHWGQIQSPWLVDKTNRIKVDPGIGLPNVHGKCFGVDSGMDIRWGYSQRRNRVPLTMFFFGFGLGLVGNVVQSPVHSRNVLVQFKKKYCTVNSAWPGSSWDSVHGS
jgi:hypothetical protein